MSVEANLIEKKARMRNERKVSFREESAPSTSSSKMERMMEEMMKNMSILERAQPRDNQNNPQNRNRNQNYRRENNQDRQRDNDQQIRPLFQQNYVDQDEEEREIERLGENHVNLIGPDNEDDVFLTEEEQGFFSS